MIRQGDGSAWTTLDTQSTQTFVARFQMKTFIVANPTAYRYNRLNITANNGASVQGRWPVALGL